VQHRGTLRRVIVHPGSKQQMSGRRAAAYYLATGIEVTALPFHGHTGTIQPVGAAGADQYQLLGGKPTEHGLAGRGQAALVSPDQGSQQVRVHGEAKRRRAVVMGQFSYHCTDIRVNCSSTAEFLRHRRGEQLALPHQFVVLRHKGAFGVMLCCLGGKARTQFPHYGHPLVFNILSFLLGISCCHHLSSPLFLIEPISEACKCRQGTSRNPAGVIHDKGAHPEVRKVRPKLSSCLAIVWPAESTPGFKLPGFRLL
jgi:hypothetical protein